MARRVAVRFVLTLVLLTAGFAALAGPADARLAISTGYILTELPAPQPDGTDRVIQGDAWAINASGDVAGDVQAAIGTNYPSYALYWRNGEPKWLGQAGQVSAGNDISKNRRVVGFIQRSASDPVTPVVWIKNEATPLKTLGGDDGAAFGINGKNRIAGWSSTAERGSTDRLIHACVWTGTTPTDLGALGDNKGDSIALDINSAGQVVGFSNPSPGQTTGEATITNIVAGGVYGAHAVLWDGGKITDLGTLGGDSSAALAINDDGAIAGTSNTKDGVHHAFLWQKGKMTDLGVLPGDGQESFAADINGSGQVVGLVAGAGAYGRVAFIWQDGQMVDLNTLIPADSGWVLLGAWAINDAGQIVGWGQGPNGTGAILLTPVT